jgi:hypothetical protein
VLFAYLRILEVVATCVEGDASDREGSTAEGDTQMLGLGSLDRGGLVALSGP